jgi:methylmalonyl-CoA mutase N-terminal domain/subunit
MKKEELDPTKDAIQLGIDAFKGSISFSFVQEYDQFETIDGLRVVKDDITEEIWIDIYECSDGRKGLIFLGKDEYGN